MIGSNFSLILIGNFPPCSVKICLQPASLKGTVGRCSDKRSLASHWVDETLKLKLSLGKNSTLHRQNISRFNSRIT